MALLAQKHDLMIEKLKRYPLGDYFPEFAKYPVPNNGISTLYKMAVAFFSASSHDAPLAAISVTPFFLSLSFFFFFCFSLTTQKKQTQTSMSRAPRTRTR